MYIYSFSVVGDTPGLLYDKVFFLQVFCSLRTQVC
uniref:Uncharacterized protein n=1 Tax=Anguilla anguilla TaxID=7936 RepID=A0A0E9SIN2_ANGAN